MHGFVIHEFTCHAQYCICAVLCVQLIKYFLLLMKWLWQLWPCSNTYGFDMGHILFDFLFRRQRGSNIMSHNRSSWWKHTNLKPDKTLHHWKKSQPPLLFPPLLQQLLSGLSLHGPLSWPEALSRERKQQLCFLWLFPALGIWDIRKWLMHIWNNNRLCLYFWAHMPQALVSL